MNKPILDLRYTHFSHRHGDHMLYGTWFGDRHQQCLVLLPTLGRNRTPLIIPLTEAWRWNPDDSDTDPAHTARVLVQYAMSNGINHYNRITMQRLLSIVHDHLSDLLSIPPTPRKRDVVADMTITNNDTGDISEREVLERV